MTLARTVMKMIAVEGSQLMLITLYLTSFLATYLLLLRWYHQYRFQNQHQHQHQMEERVTWTTLLQLMPFFLVVAVAAAAFLKVFPKVEYCKQLSVEQHRPSYLA